MHSATLRVRRIAKIDPSPHRPARLASPVRGVLQRLGYGRRARPVSGEIAMSAAKVATVNAGGIDADPDLPGLMIAMGRRARAAARALALASSAKKNAALAAMAEALRRRGPEILAASIG